MFSSWPKEVGPTPSRPLERLKQRKNGMCSSGGTGGMKRIRSACVKTSSSKTCFVSLSGDLAEAIGLRVQVCLLTIFLIYTVCGPWSATKN